MVFVSLCLFFFFKQKTAYEMRISDWSSDVCSSDLIADLLNARGIVTDLGRTWTRGTVHQVLINEKYAGDNVWNRVSFKLKRKRVRNSPPMWIRADCVFAPIVDRKLFETAQAKIGRAHV